MEKFELAKKNDLVIFYTSFEFSFFIYSLLTKVLLIRVNSINAILMINNTRYIILSICAVDVKKNAREIPTTILIMKTYVRSDLNETINKSYLNEKIKCSSL